jgi:hypothetical protein
MNYEVFPVEAPGAEIGTNSQRAKEVSEKIQSIYSDVSARSGQIIASHTLDVRNRRFSAADPISVTQYLFLVAEFYDPK